MRPIIENHHTRKARLLSVEEKTIIKQKKRIAELEALCDTLKAEAQCHAQEARTQKATVQEIYQVVSGGKGEYGDWNGVEPVKKRIAELEAKVARYEEVMGTCEWCNPCVEV